MTILDRYIARQYLFNVAALLAILFCFVVTVDVAINIDRFVRAAEEFAARDGHEPSSVRTGVVSVVLIANLWWPRLLQLFNFILGLVMVGAMGFTCVQLVRHRELVAALASGLSVHRVWRPILAVSLGLTVLQGLNQELVLPRIAPLLTRDQGDAGKASLGRSSLPLTGDGDGRLWYASVFDADAERLEGVHVTERDAAGLPTRRLTAASAEWTGQAWRLREGQDDPLTGNLAPSHFAEHAITTELSPTAMKMQRFEGYGRNLSFAQVSRMLRAPGRAEPAARASLERIRFGRFAAMLVNMLALVVTMPMFLPREPTDMLRRVLLGAGVAMIALIGGVLGTSAAVPGIPAALGVFIPVMVLSPIALASASSAST